MRSAVLIAVVAAGLLAIPPAAATETGDVALTDARVEEFVHAAAGAGLSIDDVARALADPDALAAAPVNVDVGEPVVDELAAMPRQPGMVGTDSHRRIRGYRRTVSVTYRNFWRARLVSFSMTKYWEADGRRIVAAPPPRVSGSVTALGAALGWSYGGVVGSTDHYYTWGGRWHGGHKSYRQGKFTHCALQVGCVWKKYPRLTIWAHYDGTSSARRVG